MNFDKRASTIIVNKDHASDINYSVQYTRWFLRMLGIWSLVTTEPTKAERIISKFVLPLSSIFMIILIIPMLSCVILNRGHISDVLMLFGPIVFQTSNVIKHYLIIFRSGSIKLCIQHMERDWRRIENSDDRDIMMKNVRVGHSLTIVCTLCMYGSAIFYHVVLPIFSGNTINEFNETIRPLASPGTDIFIDVQGNVTYELVFCSNCVSALFHFTVSTVVCNLAVTLVSHACGQIQIVISRIESLVGRNTEESDSTAVIDNRIAFVIKNHVRLLIFTTGIEKILREICLMEVVVATLNICFLEYYCITEWSNSDRVAMITYVVLLTSFVFNLFLYCQVGEVLKEQCEEVGKAAYMIEWYRLPGKTNLDLVMIINMGNYPRKITAGGMMELSKVSFASIMKTSFAYLNILRTST